MSTSLAIDCPPQNSAKDSRRVYFAGAWKPSLPSAWRSVPSSLGALVCTMVLDTYALKSLAPGPRKSMVSLCARMIRQHAYHACAEVVIIINSQAWEGGCDKLGHVAGSTTASALQQMRSDSAHAQPPS